MSVCPIAIVAAGAIFPGSIGVRGFWQNVLAKKDLVSDTPGGHWRIDDYYDANPKAPDKTYAKRGAFLPDVPFDAMGFGIPPTILPATDTSQLLALIVAKMTLEDIGREVDLSKTSVILGVTGAQELLGSLVSRLQRPVWERSLRGMGLSEDQVEEACKRIADHYVGWQESSFPGLLGNVVAGRIANRLNTGGTNCITDAACASALSAVHMAMLELWAGTSDMVITGGVDTMNDIFMYMCFSKTPALSMTGDCRPFDESADGTLLGEGIGMVALKRLDDAERDGDHVYGVIRGLGQSSDGRSKSVYAPVPEGQAVALRRCYEQAGYEPETVELVEAHGTATKAGDKAELEGLQLVFKAGEDKQWCALGSIKSQIGHTKATAGAAGLLKVALALHHKMLPATIKVKNPRADVNWPESAFYVNTESRPWIRGPGHPRRGSVSSFGFGGSNFHVAVEEYVGANRPARMDPWESELVAFSADTKEALLAMVAEAHGKELSELAVRTQRAFDAAKPCRVAMVVRGDLNEKLKKAAEAITSGKESSRGDVFYALEREVGAVAFLFPGQGSQSLDMGAPLTRFDEVRAALDAAEGSVPGLARVMYPIPTFTPEDRARQDALLTRTDWAQPALGALSVGVLALVREMGLVAAMTGGHSFGELVALHAAGAMDLHTLMRAAKKRGELMHAASERPGAMAAVLTTADAILPYLGDDVVIANYNAPEQTVIAGATEAVVAAMGRLEAAGLRCTRIPVGTAFHSPLVAPAGEGLSAWLRDQAISTPTLPVYRNTTAAPHTGDIAGALGEHLKSPVRFVEQIEAMYAAGARVFVEVGPGNVLTGLVGRMLKGKAHVAVSLDAKGRDALEALLAGIGRLVSIGLPLSLLPLARHRSPGVGELVAAKGSVMINGANYGKPYPRLDSVPVAPNARKERGEKVDAAPVNDAGFGAENAEPAPVIAPVVHAVRSPVADPADHAPAPQYAPVSAPAPMAAPTFAAPVSGGWISAFQEGQRQLADVHENFQRSMADAHIAFLRTQEEASRSLVAMMGASSGVTAAMPVQTPVYAPVAVPTPAPSYVQPVAMPVAMPVAIAVAAPAAAPIPARTPAPAAALDVTSLLLEVVADKTGYPATMLNLGMNLEADLGIDSIKRVEILSAMRERAPQLPEPDAETMGTLQTLGAIVALLGASSDSSAHVAAVAAPALNVTALLLEVVAEKTGYPASMLTLEMNLEADLGIDSIKRVEILSAMREKAPQLPEPDAETMGTLQTLGAIVALLGVNLPVVTAPTLVSTAAAAFDVTALLLEVVAEKTGYPANMLNLDMNLEADLGIDSIKRVEILSAMREKAPQLPEPDAETMGTLQTLGAIVALLGANSAPARAATTASSAPTTPSATPVGALDVTALLLDVVAEKTGYPAGMLNLDMNLEADLGIDSIKRVEILSAMRERAPELPEPDAETMGTLQTLGAIVALLGANSAPSLAVGRPADIAPAPTTPEPAALHRYDLAILAIGNGSVHKHGPLAVVGYDAESLATALRARGVDATTTASADRGLVYVAAPGSGDAAVRAAFVAARGANLADGGAFVTVARLGGDFGLSGHADAVLAGLSGLAKTAALEHPKAFVRAIDAGDTSTDTIADEIVRTGPVEVALVGTARHSLRSVASPTPHRAVALGSSDVVVVSGGARGVTAACVRALAAASKASFVLLGRSRIDDVEPAAAAAANDEGSLKRALASGASSPAALGKQVSAILAAREARANIAAIEASGARARYVAVDVQDAAAIAEALTTVRLEWGPITGLIHGAGVVHDKRIKEKTDAQFDAVWSTKVLGLRALLAATAADALKMLCFFSSVAARTGNVGQCDYAAANEALNKLAALEAAHRPGVVVKSIGWGPWEGGMVTPGLAKQFAAMGVELIPLAAGAQAMVEEIATPGSVEVVIGGLLPSPDDAPTIRRVHARDYPFLRDHTVADLPVFPVVLALEWFAQLARELRPTKHVVALRNVKVLKGISLKGFDGDGDLFEVVATGTDPTVLSLEIRSTNGALHYRADVELSDVAPHSPSAPAGGTIADYPHAPEEIYRKYLFHGPDFQVIQRVVGVGENAAEAMLTGTGEIGWETNGWLTDMAAGDGGLQLAVLWSRRHLNAASLPTGITAYKTYGRPSSGPVRSILTGRRTEGRRSVSDISLMDATGRVFAEMEGVELHALPAGEYPRNATS